VLARFYQEELDYLRRRAPEFAAAHPGLADALVTPGADPDVERLLEGFAFLAARVRERIEDDFPEIVYSLAGLLWPQLLRPTPSACVVEFSAQQGKVRDARTVPAGTEIQGRIRDTSLPPDADARRVGRGSNTVCRFRTCWHLDVLPMTVTAASISPGPEGTSSIRLSFRLLRDAQYAQAVGRGAGARVRMFLHSGPTAVALLAALSRHVNDVEIRAAGAGDAESSVVRLGRESIRFPGLQPGYGLLPEPAHGFSAYGVLQDYFVFPERFQFVDVVGFDRACDIGITDAFDVVVRLNEWPHGVRQVDASNFRLGCVPVVNLFEHDARPESIRREQSEYQLVPDAEDPDEMETFEVLRVGGIAAGSGQEREFEPLYSLGPRRSSGQELHGRGRVYFKTRVRPSLGAPGTETWLSLVDADEAATIPAVETIFARLRCSNGRLPSRLSPGEISEPTISTPGGLSFRDITRVMPALPPAFDAKISWRLISLLATSYLSIADRDNLRTLLRMMDFRSVHDVDAGRRLTSRLNAVDEVNVGGDDWLVRGRPVRGRAIHLVIRDRQFGGAPEVHLFGSVLDVVFAMFSSINSHTRLTVTAKDSGETFEWQARHGTQILL
jgi:type VI secretion system protein ImpG